MEGSKGIKGGSKEGSTGITGRVESGAEEGPKNAKQVDQLGSNVAIKGDNEGLKKRVQCGNKGGQ